MSVKDATQRRKGAKKPSKMKGIVLKMRDPYLWVTKA